MHTEKREDPLVELGYEVRDLNTVAIRNATIGFFIFTIASAVIGFGVYRVMNPTVFHPQAPTNRVIAGAPYPMVQTNMTAKTDIMDIRQHETAVLTAPIGWADEQKTHLHIPIDQAMQIVVAKGLKPTGESVPAVSKGHTPDPAIGEKPVPAKTTGGAPFTITRPVPSQAKGATIVSDKPATAPTSKKPN
jgi:hypothetical protein